MTIKVAIFICDTDDNRIWCFEKAHEAAIFMWGRTISKYQIYIGKLHESNTADITELAKELEEAASDQ